VPGIDQGKPWESRTCVGTRKQVEVILMADLLAAACMAGERPWRSDNNMDGDAIYMRPHMRQCRGNRVSVIYPQIS